MENYTATELEFLENFKPTKKLWEEGNRVNTSSSEFTTAAQIYEKYYFTRVSASCTECVEDMFRMLYNKLNEEKAKVPAAKAKVGRKAKQK